MIRKVLTAALIAAFTLGTTPGFACTGISLKAGDGAAIRGRTLEFGFPMQSKVLVIPAGREMSGTLPDGGKGLIYTTRYAIVGANALGLPVILDGLNDQGLSVGLFYFPNYAKYADVTKENASHALAPQEFGVWALANFATVDEVREAVKSIVLVPTPAPGLGSPQGAVAGAHFFIQDKTGKSIVVEPIDGTLKVHDAPLGVMTNAPTYDWHMTNLVDYINLSVKDVDTAKVGPRHPFGLRLGRRVAWPSRRFHSALTLRPRRGVQPVGGAERECRRRRACRLSHPEPVRHSRGRGGQLGHRHARRRDHRMDERRRPQESALVFPHPHRPGDPHGRPQAGHRRRQGRGRR